jgi:hypothetical protein
MVESVLPGIAEKEIFVSIIIIIARRYAKAISQVGAGQPCFGRDIFEATVTTIVQKAAVIAGPCFLHFRQLGAVGEEDIHFAIVVVIQNSNAAAHGLRKIFAALKVIVGSVGEVGAGGDIGVPGAMGFLRCRGGGCWMRSREKNEQAGYNRRKRRKIHWDLSQHPVYFCCTPGPIGTRLFGTQRDTFTTSKPTRSSWLPPWGFPARHR